MLGTGLNRRTAISLGLGIGLGVGAPRAMAHNAEASSAQDLFQLYRDLINAHDFDLLAERVIAPDAVFIFSDRRDQGLEAVRAGFERTWRIIPDEVYRMTDPVWIIDDPQTAVCTFDYSYSGTTTSGTGLSGGGQGITVLRRRQGQWRLCLEQLTPDTRRRA